MFAKRISVVLVLSACLAGCQSGWTLTKVATIGGMNKPESVEIDPVTGFAYASSVAPGGDPPDYWAKNNAGFISRLSPSHQADPLKWITGTPEAPLHSPKGVCIHKGVLHVADCDRIARYELATGKPLGEIRLGGADKLNDLLSHEGYLYVTDTGLGKVFRIGEDASRPLVIPAPPSANGIAFWKGRLFGVSWAQHEIYELDPTGKNPAKPLGLADRLKELDELKILDDGTMIVSEFKGNRIVAVSPDRKTVRTLAEVTTPADIGLDTTRMLLYVPAMEDNAVVVYKLEYK